MEQLFRCSHVIMDLVHMTVPGAYGLLGQHVHLLLPEQDIGSKETRGQVQLQSTYLVSSTTMVIIHIILIMLNRCCQDMVLL